MKILFVHNAYQFFGGEDSVLASEIKLLKNEGHSVKLYEVSNISINTFVKKVKVFFSTTYSHSSKKNIYREIKNFKPDIVHVHNFFPLITPSVFDACIETGVPSIQTLHNFRLICPSALLMHKNNIYEKAIHKNAYYTVFDRVYRNSFLATFIVSRMIEYHKKKKTWHLKVDKFIALTNFAKNKFIEAGLPENKISIKPNFIKADRKNIHLKNKRYGALFVGRLSDEKGIRILLKAWEKINYPIKIAGEGPLKHLIQNNTNPNVKYIGKLSKDEVCRSMQKSSFLVFPSIWYEGFPMVLIEALSNGLAIVSSNLGSMSEIIIDGYNGLHFKKGDYKDLRDKVNLLLNDKKLNFKMNENCVEDFNTNYTDKINYKILYNLYKQVIDEKKTTNS